MISVTGISRARTRSNCASAVEDGPHSSRSCAAAGGIRLANSDGRHRGHRFHAGEEVESPTFHRAEGANIGERCAKRPRERDHRPRPSAGHPLLHDAAWPQVSLDRFVELPRVEKARTRRRGRRRRVDDDDVVRLVGALEVPAAIVDDDMGAGDLSSSGPSAWKYQKSSGTLGTSSTAVRLDPPRECRAEARPHPETDRQGVGRRRRPYGQRQVGHHLRDRRQGRHADAVYQQVFAHALAVGDHRGGGVPADHRIGDALVEIGGPQGENQRQRGSKSGHPPTPPLPRGTDRNRQGRAQECDEEHQKRQGEQRPALADRRKQEEPRRKGAEDAADDVDRVPRTGPFGIAARPTIHEQRRHEAENRAKWRDSQGNAQEAAAHPRRERQAVVGRQQRQNTQDTEGTEKDHAWGARRHAGSGTQPEAVQP